MTGTQVLRRWKGVVRSADLKEYVAYIERTGLREYRATPGNDGAWMLSRTIDGGRVEVVTLSLWDSREAIVAFAGESIERARFYPDDDKFLLERDLTVDHFDVEWPYGNAEIQRKNYRTSAGNLVSYLTAGDPTSPTIVLQHGFPNSSEMFRSVLPVLARSAFVIAPDLPGFGQSEPLPNASFDRLTDSIHELVDALGVSSFYLYVHDFGAPVMLQIAMADPGRVRGLIVQNANAHETGFGPDWEETIRFWQEQTPEREELATSHLTLEGTRAQYVAGVPADVVESIVGDPWEEDWRVMNLDGRMATQRALIADYGRYVEQFPEIDEYLRSHQPPTLMLWGRHDAFFDIAETVSWMRALPRMEAHVLDAGHLLLETHAAQAATLIATFVERTELKRGEPLAE